MRTELQLREVLSSLADQAPAPDAVWSRVSLRPQPRTVRRRRTALVLAVAAVVVALVLALPTLLVRQTVVPADQRVPGNWNLIHRVDPPPGWMVEAQSVRESQEITNLRNPTAGQAGDSYGCLVQVFARGLPDPDARTKHRRAVDVNGHPGLYVAPTDNTSGGVTWSYEDGAFARVSCGTTLALDLDVARRVRFTVTETRLPFRLRSLPAGYHVQVVYPPLVRTRPDGTDDTPLEGGVQLEARSVEPSPGIGIVVSPGTTEVPEHIPGWETTTVHGVPAVLSAEDGKLCLNPPGHTVCVETGREDQDGAPSSSWPNGRRELLLAVADSMVLARHLDDPKTWFVANDTLG